MDELLPPARSETKVEAMLDGKGEVGHRAEGAKDSLLVQTGEDHDVAARVGT